jgi:hypothetical protein
MDYPKLSRYRWALSPLFIITGKGEWKEEELTWEIYQGHTVEQCSKE